MHYKLIRSILNKAVQWKYLSKNPCSLIAREDIPKPNYRRLPIWQENDLKRFLNLVEDLDDSPMHIKYKLMVSLSSITGARRGEFFSLTWDCIDFDKKQIYINKSCDIRPHHPMGLKKPKTPSSVRWIGIDDYTIALLRKQKTLQEKYLIEKSYENPKQFVFLARRHTTYTNEVMPAYPTGFLLWLKGFCKKHGLPPITVHSFRHMTGTYALAYGVPLTTVQAMLGHTDIKTTAIYLHELESKKQEATQILSKQFWEFRN